ncbi:site-specific integrase [uncultured Erythrobacter sp.]|uniref:tyrosine-type recombinase/integrase n=1 Tax=uncultured Erythrobacter sp. TaxID=263913 RepID=UPI00261FE380|nr:site-specific integrase [uncultured Erythrobacter sp.]
MPKLSDTRLTKSVVEAAQPGQTISDSEVRGFRLVVSKSGTRRFVASYRIHGRSSMKALGAFPTFTVQEARDMAREVLRKVRAGVDPHVEERAAREAEEAAKNAPTVESLSKVYLEDYAPSQALRSSTIRHARQLSRIAIEALGSKKVEAVTITDIRKLHGDTRAAGIARGTKGVYQANRLLALLSKLFSLAIERGWRNDNPCRGVRKFPEDQRWQNLSEGEVKRLLRACEDYAAGLRPVSPDDDPETVEHKTKPLPETERSATDREAADAIRLLLFTGARLQEVLKAEWSQFDLERGLWQKPSAHTKTKRIHRLELEGPALETLKAMFERKSHSVYLFPGSTEKRRKSAPVDINSGEPVGIGPRADLKHPWRAITALAGLEGVRLHDLRRTLASFMLSGGSTLATVGKALGHTQASTTARYATLEDSVQREGLKAAGERMVGSSEL